MKDPVFHHKVELFLVQFVNLTSKQAISNMKYEIQRKVRQNISCLSQLQFDVMIMFYYVFNRV